MTWYPKSTSIILLEIRIRKTEKKIMWNLFFVCDSLSLSYAALLKAHATWKSKS